MRFSISAGRTRRSEPIMRLSGLDQPASDFSSLGQRYNLRRPAVVRRLRFARQRFNLDESVGYSTRFYGVGAAASTNLPIPIVEVASQFD
jgi:hypothetical protein